MTSSNGSILRVTCPVWGFLHSPVNSPHKGEWRGALMLSLICAWINGWVNNSKAVDLRHHRAHYDVTVMNDQNNRYTNFNSLWRFENYSMFCWLLAIKLNFLDSTTVTDIWEPKIISHFTKNYGVSDRKLCLLSVHFPMTWDAQVAKSWRQHIEFWFRFSITECNLK